jgi:hypothetical protein
MTSFIHLEREECAYALQVGVCRLVSVVDSQLVCIRCQERGYFGYPFALCEFLIKGDLECLCPWRRLFGNDNALRLRLADEIDGILAKFDNIVVYYSVLSADDVFNLLV